MSCRKHVCATLLGDESFKAWMAAEVCTVSEPPAAERVVGVQLEAAVRDAAGPLAPCIGLRSMQHGRHALARLAALLLRHRTKDVGPGGAANEANPLRN